MDIAVAAQFFALPESRTHVKWINLSDVGSLYARGFLPIISNFVSAGQAVRVRVDGNPQVERWLRTYGYGDLLTKGCLATDPVLPQAVRQYARDDQEPHDYVTSAVEEFLRRGRTTRTAAQSLEWALGELIGNVFHHANSPIGLLVQFLVQPGHQCIFTVVDTGIGIRKSLEGDPLYKSATDRLAIDAAIRKGITSKRENAGQGLFGSIAIVEAAHGSFMLWSGASALFVEADGQRTYRDMPYFQGTIVDWRMPTHVAFDLQTVLSIENEPLTLLWERYEAVPGELVFPIGGEATSFANRSVAQKLRNKLIAVARSSPVKRCVVDFDGVRMISSSFADEFLGKFAQLCGEEYYKKYVRLTNINDLMLGIINDAIQQRLRRERAERAPIRIPSVQRRFE